MIVIRTVVLGLLFLPAVGIPGAAEGALCGGAAAQACPVPEWCDLKAGLCGAAAADGACVKVPAVCTTVYRPVCGCDGKTYGNDCERQRAKVQKQQDGPCS